MNHRNNLGKSNNVCLFGASLDTGNRGVSALAASTIKLILAVFPKANISLLVGNRSKDTRVLRVADQLVKINIINYRLSPRASIQEHLFWIFLLAVIYRIIPSQAVRNRILKSNQWLKTLFEADFVGAINGGDSFSDIYGLWRFAIGSVPSIIALLLNKELILLPQTYGPYKFRLAKLIARYIIGRSARILSRDHYSPKVIWQIMDRAPLSKCVEFCPDVAFTLESNRSYLVDIRPPLEPDRNCPLIGININGLMFNGGYNRKNMFGLKVNYKMLVQRLIGKFLSDTTAHIVLIPHTFAPKGDVNSDPEACLEILQAITGRYKNRVHLITSEYDQYEIKAIIGLCDFFIGSRMHACIAALSQGIPAVGIAYSQKFKGVFNSIGAENLVIEARMVDDDTAISDVFRHFQNRSKLKVILEERVEPAIMIVKNKFREILGASPLYIYKENEMQLHNNETEYAK